MCQSCNLFSPFLRVQLYKISVGCKLRLGCGWLAPSQPHPRSSGERQPDKPQTCRLLFLFSMTHSRENISRAHSQSPSPVFWSPSSFFVPIPSVLSPHQCSCPQPQNLQCDPWLSMEGRLWFQPSLQKCFASGKLLPINRAILWKTDTSFVVLLFVNLNFSLKFRFPHEILFHNIALKCQRTHPFKHFFSAVKRILKTRQTPEEKLGHLFAEQDPNRRKKRHN